MRPSEADKLNIALIRELFRSEQDLQRTLMMVKNGEPVGSPGSVGLGASNMHRGRVARFAYLVPHFIHRALRVLKIRLGRRTFRWVRAKYLRAKQLFRSGLRALDTKSPLRDSAEIRRSGQQVWKERIADFAVVEAPRLNLLSGAHRGKRCFIIGNGPSLEKMDLSPLVNEETFVTNWFANHPDIESIQPSFYCICSHELFGGWGTVAPAFNKDLRIKIEGMPQTRMFLPYRFRSYVESENLFQKHDRNYLLYDRPKRGIDEVGRMQLDLTQPLFDGYTVILVFCLPLAKLMGFKEIYLLGLDSNYGDNQAGVPKRHFYDESMHTSKSSAESTLHRLWSPGGPVFRSYQVALETFRQAGVSITNLTPEGRLDVFPREDFSAILDRL